MSSAFALAFLAGVLSTLSPCVLPLLPIVLGAAASEHRWGPLALAAGLAASFVAVGLFVAVVGFSIGVGGDFFRAASAVALIGLGVVLLVPRLQARFALAAGPVGEWADARLRALSPRGISGQFAVGVLLGALWSPCVGPTLGAASTLAAEGRDLGQVALTMSLFGLGAALPLLGLGVLSREATMRWRGRLMSAGDSVKKALGAVLIVVAGATLLGFDRIVETALVDASPSWLTTLTTRF
ncbi:MAG: cytochrome c biogenesis CcdA family protein [Roseiarcus sp.]